MIYECFKHLSTCTGSTDNCKHTKMNVNIKCYEQSEMAAIMDFSNFIKKNNNNNGINLFIEGSSISPEATSSLRELFDATWIHSYTRMASLIRTRQSDLIETKFRHFPRGNLWVQLYPRMKTFLLVPHRASNHRPTTFWGVNID